MTATIEHRAEATRTSLPAKVTTARVDSDWAVMASVDLLKGSEGERLRSLIHSRITHDVALEPRAQTCGDQIGGTRHGRHRVV